MSSSGVSFVTYLSNRTIILGLHSVTMNWKYSVYFLIFLLKEATAVTEKDVSQPPVYKMTDRVNKCSKYLSAVIDALCNNSYKIVKRDTSIIMDKILPKNLMEYTSKERQHARRMRRQVATECCEKVCTVGDIILYCPDNAKLYKENPELFVDY